jgi:hypothetical protein
MRRGKCILESKVMTAVMAESEVTIFGGCKCYAGGEMLCCSLQNGYHEAWVRRSHGHMISGATTLMNEQVMKLNTCAIMDIGIGMEVLPFIQPVPLEGQRKERMWYALRVKVNFRGTSVVRYRA